jgi:hypothetical protein
MQTGLQAEVLLCPNCKEEVPKTLYCLNCGYPLYKIELDQPEEDVEVVVDAAPEPVEDEPVVEAEMDDDVVIVVEDVTEPFVEEAVEADLEIEVKPEPTEVVEAVEITEFVEEAEPEIKAEPVPEVIEEETEPIIEVAEPDVEVEPVPETVKEVTEPIIEVAEPQVEEVLEIPLEESIESVEASVFEVVEGPEIEDVEKGEGVEPVAELVIELEPSYEPDPVIREIMENFAKNLSMKIKLVGLLRDGGVKPEIFERLFESYVARGELLMNSRSEMLERVRYDLDSMEKALNEAKVGLEELEIRRAINDVSEEEYAAKSPGFEWDIRQYKDEVGRKKAEISYLEDIKRVMSPEEIEGLIETGEGCSELIESEKIGSEMASRVRLSLEEALSCLRASG